MATAGKTVNPSPLEVRREKRRLAISLISFVRSFKTMNPTAASLQAAQEVEDELAGSLEQPAAATASNEG